MEKNTCYSPFPRGIDTPYHTGPHREASSSRRKGERGEAGGKSLFVVSIERDGLGRINRLRLGYFE